MPSKARTSTAAIEGELEQLRSTAATLREHKEHFEALIAKHEQEAGGGGFLALLTTALRAFTEVVEVGLFGDDDDAKPASPPAAAGETAAAPKQKNIRKLLAQLQDGSAGDSTAADHADTLLHLRQVTSELQERLDRLNREIAEREQQLDPKRSTADDENVEVEDVRTDPAPVAPPQPREEPTGPQGPSEPTEPVQPSPGPDDNDPPPVMHLDDKLRPAPGPVTPGRAKKPRVVSKIDVKPVKAPDVVTHPPAEPSEPPAPIEDVVEPPVTRLKDKPAPGPTRVRPPKGSDIGVVDKIDVPSVVPGDLVRPPIADVVVEPPVVEPPVVEPPVAPPPVVEPPVVPPPVVEPPVVTPGPIVDPLLVVPVVVPVILPDIDLDLDRDRPAPVEPVRPPEPTVTPATDVEQPPVIKLDDRIPLAPAPLSPLRGSDIGVVDRIDVGPVTPSIVLEPPIVEPIAPPTVVVEPVVVAPSIIEPTFDPRAQVEVGELAGEIYDVDKLLRSGTSVADLRARDIPAGVLTASGVAVSALMHAGYTTAELKEAGVPAMALRVEGVSVAALHESGYALDELRQVAALSELQSFASAADLRNAGYSAAELRDAYPVSQLSILFSAHELKDAGFRVDELRNSVGLGELRVAFDLAELSGSFGPAELRGEGVSASELMHAGVSLGALCDAGFSSHELQDAGADVAELRRLFPHESFGASDSDGSNADRGF